MNSFTTRLDEMPHFSAASVVVINFIILPHSILTQTLYYIQLAEYLQYYHTYSVHFLSNYLIPAISTLKKSLAPPLFTLFFAHRFYPYNLWTHSRETFRHKKIEVFSTSKCIYSPLCRNKSGFLMINFLNNNTLVKNNPILTSFSLSTTLLPLLLQDP